MLIVEAQRFRCKFKVKRVYCEASKTLALCMLACTNVKAKWDASDVKFSQLARSRKSEEAHSEELGMIKCYCLHQCFQVLKVWKCLEIYFFFRNVVILISHYIFQQKHLIIVIHKSNYLSFVHNTEQTFLHNYCLRVFGKHS